MEREQATGAMGMMGPTAVTPMGVPLWWLMNLLVTIESTFPAGEVLHSLHSQAVSASTALRDLPAMQAFADASMRHLHAKVIVAGYIRRVLAGDTAAATMAGLREQLEAYHRTHGEMRTAFTKVLGAVPVRENLALQSMNQVMGLMDQAHHAVLSLVQPLLTAQPGAAQPDAAQP